MLIVSDGTSQPIPAATAAWRATRAAPEDTLAQHWQQVGEKYRWTVRLLVGADLHRMAHLGRIHQVRARGEVVWVRPQGGDSGTPRMGARFLEFDEGAEFFDAGDATVVELAHFDLGAATAEGVDFLHGAVHGVGVVRINEDLAGVVFGDVDLRAGGLGDAADGLAARADEQADLLGVDLHRHDPRRVGRQLGARRIDGRGHDHGRPDSCHEPRQGRAARAAGGDL